MWTGAIEILQLLLNTTVSAGVSRTPFLLRSDVKERASLQGDDVQSTHKCKSPLEPQFLALAVFLHELKVEVRLGESLPCLLLGSDYVRFV